MHTHNIAICTFLQGILTLCSRKAKIMNIRIDLVWILKDVWWEHLYKHAFSAWLSSCFVFLCVCVKYFCHLLAKSLVCVTIQLVLIRNHECGCKVPPWSSTHFIQPCITTVILISSSKSSPTTLLSRFSYDSSPNLNSSATSHPKPPFLLHTTLDLFCPFTYSQMTGDFDIAMPLSPLMRAGLWRKPS